MPGSLAEVGNKDLLKSSHRRLYQEQMKAILALAYVVRFVLHTIALTW
jgi:hypothetical protein